MLPPAFAFLPAGGQPGRVLAVGALQIAIVFASVSVVTRMAALASDDRILVSEF